MQQMNSNSDPRKLYIANHVKNIFQINDVPKSFYSNNILDNFLDQVDISAIKIIQGSNSSDIQIMKIEPLSPNKSKEQMNGVNNLEICISKVRNEEISPNNLQQNLIINTLNSNPLLSLLNNLKNVYLPTLQNSDKIDNNIKRLLDELKIGLDNTLFVGSGRENFDESDFLSILSPVDEFDFWKNAEGSVANAIMAQRSRFYNDKFSKIYKYYKDLKSFEIVAMKEIIDNTLEVLDTVWNFVSKGGEYYKDARMKHLLDLISTAIGGRVQSEFSEGELWDGSFSNVKLKLTECLKCCKAWVDGVAQYTGQIWSSKQLIHRWKEERYSNQFMNNLILRINEIMEIRTQHDELLRMYAQNQNLKIDINEIFNPFKQINCLHVSVFSQSTWQNAKLQYSKNMENIDKEIANILRNDIFNSDNPIQQVRDIQKWQGLLARQSLMKILTSERDILLNNLYSQVDRIKEEFESRSGQIIDAIAGMDVIPNGHNFSKVVNSITWVRQLSAKLKKYLTVSQNCLSDLKKFANFSNSINELSNSMKDYENEQFESWKNEILQILKQPDQTLSLQLSGKLMELDLDDGLLKVNYSERLVLLLREVRQLSELGFRKQIPQQIIDTVEVGKKFYKEALTLKQVANFFNSMSSQIIESQKPMLVDLVINFEKIVKSTPRKSERNAQGTTEITWDNPVELENYINRVQEAAQHIMNENRKLRKVHQTICDQLNDMFNIDLLKHKQLWKEQLDSLRKTVDNVCINKDPKLCKSWRVHWDYQLYKVLEYQYQKGLELLNQNTQEIKIEIIYSNKNIGFRPSIEEIKQRYYKEVKSFITLPSSNFMGFGGNTEIFKQMPEKNSDYLTIVYAKTEELFVKLMKFLDTFKAWTSLGVIDIEKIINEYFKTNEDWENNLKNLRLKRRDLEKIPETYKIDCFSISLSPFKNSIEDLLQNLIDAITSNLKNSIKADCDAIDEFITQTVDKLSKKPQTIAEITQCKAEIYDINEQRKKFREKFGKAEEKNKLLRNMVSNHYNISQTAKRLENFDITLEGFTNTLDEQQEVIKGDIEKRVKELNNEIEKFYNRWSALKPKKIDQLDRESAKETALKLKEWRIDWEAIEKRTQTVDNDSTHFNLPKPQFTNIQQIREELGEQENSWKFYDEFSSELEELEKQDWLTFRTKIYSFQDFIFKWTDKVKTMKKDAVGLYLLTQMDIFKQIWPIFKHLLGEGFEKEHWRTLFNMLKLPKEVTIEILTFGHFLSAEQLIINKEQEIKELAARAQGEVTLREAINELRVWCETADFNLVDYTQNGRTTPLIKEWKDLMTKVSDNQALLGTLKESKFYQRFSDQIEQFEAKLGGIDDYLQKLNVIQRKWVYLEPIFGRGALPQEQGRFKRLDEEFRGIMLGIQRDPKVVGLCAIPGIKDTLEQILDQLERCQKALNDFLEEKRTKFPRFYFLGDDDLLEILGRSKDPTVIQMHLKKLFAGINSVQFSSKGGEILAMKSSANEIVNLHEAISVDDEIENWLGLLSKNMQKTLQISLQMCLKEPNLELNKYPSQILCLSEEINFNMNCSRALQQGKLANYKNELMGKLDQFTSNIPDNMLLQLKLKSLILDLIHQIEVVDNLIKGNAKDITDWLWYKQLKFSMTQICQISMCKAAFDYTYEYQGNASKLVHTPLTDKCYLTLTQGMSMGYGGNPYGPAGTGKTESVKALGQAFGRQVLVFNCDEGIDFKSMGRIFIGLVKCGAWGCFDEFNRLLEEQLSAISQQIQVIQWAIKEKQPQVDLLGKTIEVNKNAGIFVTLNPAGKGYGGRSKLPDNLKQLFRPVAMSVPDNELIAEVLLFSEGFKTAKILAQKIVAIFNLSKQLLSYQQHYDWGLRALKTILTVGGQLIQEERRKNVGKKIDEKTEQTLLIKAIRINTMSKLTYGDSKKFVGILNDVFPGIKPEDILYEQLTEAIHEVLKEMKLDKIETQITKILQFYEATKQRMGIVLVGPSGSGKTIIWKVLKKAHEKLNQEVKTYIMNPKSMPRTQLLGHMDNDTREFTEGVLTSSARSVVKQPSEVLNWIICDGDIDPEWIESLNSVLDDNHLLTLPTGERINFSNNVNFIFETNDLKYASPATVSRMGMIFLNYEDINIKSLINKWIKRQSEDNQSKLEQYIEELFYKSFEIILQYEEQLAVKTTRVGTIMNVLSQMVTNTAMTKGEFIQNLVRGLAANFPPNSRIQVCDEIFKLVGQKSPVDQKTPLDFYYSKDSNLFKPYQVDISKELREHDFVDLNEPPLVKTIGIQRDLDMIRSWIQACEPFIIVGPEGCGKNMVIRYAFNELRQQQKIQISVISCNAQTSATQIIQKLNQICLKATFAQGRIYKPKECSRLVIYLKDINLPKPDKYQTIQMIAFLQQIITHKGFYDENLEFVYLDDKIQIVASMNPASTLGRYELSTRFTANVRICYMDYPTQEELNIIYNEYLKGVFNSSKFNKVTNKNPANMQQLAKKISPFLVELYQNVKQKFQIDEHRHYLYTPSNLTSIVSGLLRYEELQSIDHLMEVIAYECCRVFKDRLVNFESQAKFDGILMGLMKSHLKYSTNLQGIYYSSLPNVHEIKEGSKQIPNLSRLSKDDVKQLIDQGLITYEREFTELKLHKLDEILSLITQIDRILSRPGGTSLMCGRSGIGRRITLLLTAHMLRLQVFQPQITRDYSSREFKKDLKLALENAGVLGKPSLLFIEDHHIIKKEFLEMLNSLISSGEVPGLYRPEEIDPMFGGAADEVRRENFGKSLYECFIARIQQNLRIVVSFDHGHPDFGSNTASNPALFSKCSLLWIDNWNKESYLAIAKAELEEFLNNYVVLNNKEELMNAFISIHRGQLSLNRASPRHYFALIEAFKKIFEGKIQSRGDQTSHLQAGLKKLIEAKELVDELSKKAHEQKQELAKKQGEADEALKNIKLAMEKVAERKQETAQLQKSLQEEEIIIQSHKSKIEAELSGIQPLIDEAKSAVGSISRNSLDELKSFKMPPEPIHDVLSVVLRMMGNYDNSWNSMKRFLQQRSVIESILNFDAHNINAEMRKELEKMIHDKASSFEKNVIYRASQAAGPLADWVKAMLKYSIVLDKIFPLEDELNKLQKKLEVSGQRLIQCKQQLLELDQRVVELQGNFQKRTGEAEALRVELKKAEDTLGAAKNLLDKLGDEKVRWQKQVEQIESQIKSLPFDSLLAAGFTIYMSDADEILRENTMKEWKALSKNNNFDFMKFISTESMVLKWKTQGLPGDSLSLENSLIIFNTSKAPLLIDPNVQASEWLKRHFSTEKHLEILNQNDPKFATLLELAIRFGKILIIQEIDQVEPVLFPVLRRDLFRQGPRCVVQIGEKVVDYNENFRIYMLTRNPFIAIPPNTAALISVINYTVTRSGLEGQLLSIIINHEQPELEKTKTELLHKEENLKIQLADLEKSLLEELASSKGNILENLSLIESLNQTKSKSNTIATSLKQSTELQASLDKQREVFRPLANKGSKLFITITDLQKINNMYRFSLASFIKLFKKCLEMQAESDDLAKKLEGNTSTLFRLTFNNIGTSLFKQDRLMFGLHIVKCMKPELFEPNEWEYFLGNAIGNVEARTQFPKWASEDRREAFMTYASIFGRVIGQLSIDSREVWGPWYTDMNCERNFPQITRGKLSSFQRVLLVQIFRPDRVESALTLFVCESLGISSISSQTLSMKNLYREDSAPDMPILFVTSPGSDPSKELEEFAETAIGRDNFQQLSMGGNQNDIAIVMLKEAASKGMWLCFKNLHLVTSWLPTLEKELKTVQAHKNFRLWLTTEPHSKFPAILLESCHKVTYEAPPGIKKNLQRTYGSWSPSFIEQGSQLRAQMYFILAWFHAVIQERRTYIPQGWSKFYEFSYGDLKAGCSIIDTILEGDDKNVKWETLYGLLEFAIYGGRIDNELDMRVLRAYLEQYYNPQILFESSKIANSFSVPQSKMLKDYLGVINKLQEIDNPSIFGLPMNIDRSVQRYNTTIVIDGMKKLATGGVDDLKFDREKWSNMLGPLVKLWKSLHKQLTEKGLPQIRDKQLNAEDSVESFIYTEAYNCYQMIEVINNSIEGINKVIFGSGLLTSEIQNEAMELLIGNIPAKWITIWDGPVNSNSWLKGFAKRAYNLRNWLEFIKNGNLFANELNLADLYHPEIFLNAVRQKTSRKLGTPIDSMKLVAAFESEKIKSPVIIKVKGFMMQGCAFDGRQMAEPGNDLPEFITLPTCYLAWNGESDSEPYPAKATSIVPIYVSSNREKMLCKLKLPNSGDPNSRIIGGVAVLISEDE